ncbi:MAG TPA: GNAT family N-acetyltransferase [Acidimicrobiales bacterium]
MQRFDAMAEELEDLAGVPPEEFVAARDALVKRLKAEGRSTDAARVKGMRRPSVPAWMAAEIRRQRGDLVVAVVDASTEVAGAQSALVAGGDREVLRAATSRRRAALAALGRAVDDLLAGAGRPSHYRDAVLQLIEAEVLAEVAPGTFGLPDDLPVPVPAAEPSPSTIDLGTEEPRSEAQTVGPGPTVRIRPAIEDDLPAITEIYNSTIPTTTAAWTEDLQTLDEREAWFQARMAEGDVVLVAEAAGGGAEEGGGGAEEAGEVVGFAGYGEFRDNRLWSGYRTTVEHTIHVRESHRDRGIGGQLIEALVSAAAAHGLHVMVAAIDGANLGSCAFHSAHGFVEVARMPETGRKFGRWLDLVLMQRVLE